MTYSVFAFNYSSNRSSYCCAYWRTRRCRSGFNWSGCWNRGTLNYGFCFLGSKSATTIGYSCSYKFMTYSVFTFDCSSNCAQYMACIRTSWTWRLCALNYCINFFGVESAISISYTCSYKFVTYSFSIFYSNSIGD